MLTTPRIPTAEEAQQGEKLWRKLERTIETRIGKRTTALMRRFGDKLLDRGELTQAGRMGAWTGCWRYEGSHGAAPLTYVEHWMHGEMWHYVRDRFRERGCPAWRFEAKTPPDLEEVPFDEATENDRTDCLADPHAQTELADALDGDWSVFRAALPPRLRQSLDGMLLGLQVIEAARRYGWRRATEKKYRANIRRMWLAFERVDRAGRCRKRKGEYVWVR